MKKTMVLTLACLTALATTPRTLADDDHKSDRKFILDAAEDSYLLVIVGQLAQTNTTNVAIQQLGQSLINSNTALYLAAGTVASNLSTTLPGTLSDDEQKLYRKLSKKTGAKFDKAFVEAVLDVLDDIIEDFTDAAKKGKDPSVRALARAQLPQLVAAWVAALDLKDTLPDDDD
jgi:putative membrane protein